MLYNETRQLNTKTLKNINYKKILMTIYFHATIYLKTETKK